MTVALQITVLVSLIHRAALRIASAFKIGPVIGQFREVLLCITYHCNCYAYKVHAGTYVYTIAYSLDYLNRKLQYVYGLFVKTGFHALPEKLLLKVYCSSSEFASSEHEAPVIKVARR